MIWGSIMMVQPLLNSLPLFSFFMEMRILLVLYLLFPNPSRAETIFHQLFEPMLMSLSTLTRSIASIFSETTQAATQAAAVRGARQAYSQPAHPNIRTNSGRRESHHNNNDNQHAPSPSHQHATSSGARRLTRSQSSKKCAICLDSMDTDVHFNYGLPCGHAYHIKCIYECMKTKRRSYEDMSCPECKYALEEEVYQDAKSML